MTKRKKNDLEIESSNIEQEIKELYTNVYSRGKTHVTTWLSDFVFEKNNGFLIDFGDLDHRNTKSHFIVNPETLSISKFNHNLTDLFSMIKNKFIKNLELAMTRPDIVCFEITPMIDPDSDSIFSTKIDIYVVNGTFYDVGQWSVDKHKTISKFVDDFLTMIYSDIKIYPPSNLDQKIEGNESILINENNFNLTLWDFQVKNLSWIAKIESMNAEDRIKSRFSLSNKIQIQNSAIQLKETSNYNGFGSIRFTDKTDEPNYLSCRGGLICDKTGAGKTVTIIASILNQKMRGIPTPPTSKKLFTSAATLIICPKYLLEQWRECFVKCLGDNFIRPCSSDKCSNEQIRYYIIKSNNEIRKCNLDILMNKVDVVITHRDIFKSMAYRRDRLSSSDEKYIQDYRYLSKLEGRIAHLKDQLARSVINLESINECYLESIKWFRVIHDEIHELINLNFKQCDLPLKIIKGFYTWGLTATPIFSKNKSKGGFDYFDLLRARSVDENDVNTYGSGFSQNEGDALSTFVRSFTRRGNNIVDVAINHRRVDVQLSQKEMAIYQSKRYQTTSTLVEFCCHHSNDSCNCSVQRAFENVNQTMNKKINKLESSILSNEKKFSGEEKLFWKASHDLNGKAQQAINQLSGDKKSVEYWKSVKRKILNSNSLEDVRGIMDHVRLIIVAIKKIRTLKTSLTTTRSQYQYYQNTLKFLSNPDDELKCNICYEMIEKIKTPFLQCGHSFHLDCLKHWFATSQTCPQCRAEAPNTKDIMILDRTAKNDDVEVGNDIYGSKIKILISLIHEIVSSDRGKIIVFAQWQNLMKKISSALEEFEIKNVIVSGSVYSCAASIKKFKEDPECNVIMLSSEHNLSGINLPEASDIIFVHPLTIGDNDKIFKQQQQAIGRVLRIGQIRDINVHHMVTLNTIEEGLYEEQKNFALLQPEFNERSRFF